jgi:pSer/pThr/pTyr-binding forkhead associated (FHA) protein
VVIQLEIISAGQRRRVTLDQDRTLIGQAADNGIALREDAAVSRLHSLIERFATGAVLSDLGSANGTWVNGRRILSPHRLRDGDEIRAGETRLIVHESDVSDAMPTDRQSRAPELTTRERDVLVSLCRPLLAGDLFIEPASSRSIAEHLVITTAAVNQHLARLYDKFDVSDDPNRRARLANAALRSGAVSISDLRGAIPE